MHWAFLEWTPERRRVRSWRRRLGRRIRVASGASLPLRGRSFPPSTGPPRRPVLRRIFQCLRRAVAYGRDPAWVGRLQGKDFVCVVVCLVSCWFGSLLLSLGCSSE